jgi:acetyl esterase/lipase
MTVFNIAERREQFAAMFTRPLPADLGVSATTLGGRSALELRSTTPGTAGEDVLLYLHGGGFVVGSARAPRQPHVFQLDAESAEVAA